MFSISRFCKYFAYNMRLGRKTYLVSLGALIGALLIPTLWTVCFNTWELNCYASEFYEGEDPMWSSVATMFGFGIFIFCCFAASLTFSAFSTKGKCINELMLPASKLEKFVADWIIYVPMALLAFYLCFGVADWIRIFLISIKIHTTHLHHFYTSEVFSDTFTPDKITLAILFVGQSWFVLCSSLWPKRSVIKGLVALVVLVMVYALWGTWITTKVYNPDLVYSNVWPEPVDPEAWLRAGMYVLALCLTLLAWWRYRQTELVQRY